MPPGRTWHRRAMDEPVGRQTRAAAGERCLPEPAALSLPQAVVLPPEMVERSVRPRLRRCVLQIGLLGGRILRLSGGQVESLFDMGLPVEVRELPADLAALWPAPVPGQDL